MKDPIQLTLWDWLEEASQVAAQMPELVTVRSGMDVLDSAMNALADQAIPAQLAVAAEAFAKLSAILEMKSEQWLNQWEAHGQTPSLDLSSDWAVGLVRQPVHFDLSPLVESPEPSPKPKRQKRTAESPIVAPVSQDNLLALVDLLSDPTHIQFQLASLAGLEEPGRWQEAIAEQWPEEAVQTSFTQLQQQTGLASVELWLGLLLGGYTFSRPTPTGPIDPAEFYCSDFQVTRFASAEKC